MKLFSKKNKYILLVGLFLCIVTGLKAQTVSTIHTFPGVLGSANMPRSFTLKQDGEMYCVLNNAVFNISDPSTDLKIKDLNVNTSTYKNQLIDFDSSNNLYFIQKGTQQIENPNSNFLLCIFGNTQYCEFIDVDVSKIKRKTSEGTIETLLSDPAYVPVSLVADNVGNVYFVNFSNDDYTIKKLTPAGEILDIASLPNDDVKMFCNLQGDFFYHIPISSGAGYNKIKKISAENGSESILYNFGDWSFISDFTINAAGDIYLIENECGHSTLKKISSGGDVISLYDFPENFYYAGGFSMNKLGQLFYLEYNSNITDIVYLSKMEFTEGSTLLETVLGGFVNQTKTLFESAYTVTPPTSNSTGLFTYTSSNPAVATIVGNVVTIVGPGSTTITANQGATEAFLANSISHTLTVASVSVVTPTGQITTSSPIFVNKYGAINSDIGSNAYGESLQLRKIVYGDGLTPVTASISAYQIKLDYPSSVDGFYWIANPAINEGNPFKIYADMTTDGGGWTLILCNKSPNPGWNSSNALLRNETNPSSNSTYSIIGWADYIKKSASGFQYMIDAGTRGSHGGIWTANTNYSFVSTSNANTNITLNNKFGIWVYNDDGIEERMPWYSTGGQGIITTSFSADSSWWGTLIAHNGWSPAPWIHPEAPHPDIIWYWVR